MKSRNIIYKYGHFYDLEQNKRIVINDGAEICVVGSSDAFSDVKPVGHKVDRPLKSSELKERIEQDKKIIDSKKLFDAGKELYFSISVKGHHRFKAVMLEDLYIVRKKSDEQHIMHNCACMVVENINKSIEPFAFEYIYARSLNELFKNTYIHYFGNTGNPARNVFVTFYEDPKNEKGSLLENYREKKKKDTPTLT